MASLFRLAQSALAQPAAGGYSNPHHAPHLAHPDLDAFHNDDNDDSDADSDQDSHDVRSPADQRRPAAAGARSGTGTAVAHNSAAGSSSSAPTLQQHTPLPGGYDFEPQAEPVRTLPTATPSRPRPDLTSSSSASFAGGPLALPQSRRASLSSRNLRDGVLLQQSNGDHHQQQQPALAAWRGFVTRFRGGGGGGDPSAPSTGSGEEGHGLLFSQDDSEDPSDADWPNGPRSGQNSNRYPPPRDPHLPLPPRPPQFAPPPTAAAASSSSSSVPTAAAAGQRIFGGGQGNDGVFANLAAKPDNPGGLDIVGEGPDKDEILPPYEAAQHDPSPAYWETTVVAPSGPLGPDDILVDGMPVGNVFSFAWNLLVSMSFQFVGFLLTFILHTTHAAKNGSRAGLGITLIQLGFYLKQRTDGLSTTVPGDETGLNGGLGPSESEQSWSWWNGPGANSGYGVQPTGTSFAPDATATIAGEGGSGGGVFGSLPTQVHGALAGVLAASGGDGSAQPGGGGPSGMPTLQGDGATLEEMQRMSEAANEWMAFVLVTIGSFLLIGSCLAYWRAVRWARAVRAGQGPNNDAESVVAI
ncbi:hypothetical protein JCM3774_005164 [Rhodotorula dairenensis]